MNALLVFGLPLVVFGSLALLPPGRAAVWGLAVAALLAATLRALSGDPVLPMLAGAGIALAAVAQGVRAALGPCLPHPLYLAFLPALALTALALLFVLNGA